MGSQWNEKQKSIVERSCCTGWPSQIWRFFFQSGTPNTFTIYCMSVQCIRFSSFYCYHSLQIAVSVNCKKISTPAKHSQTSSSLRKSRHANFFFISVYFVGCVDMDNKVWMKKCNDLVLLVENGSGTSFDLLLTEE